MANTRNLLNMLVPSWGSQLPRKSGDIKALDKKKKLFFMLLEAKCKGDAANAPLL